MFSSSWVLPFSGQVYCLLFEKACTRKLVYGSRRFAKKCFHFGNIKYIYIYTYTHSRVSFCDGSFYDDSLLRHLSSRTEHSRLVAHHCRNSSVFSLLSALLALYRCACVSYFSILIQFFFKLIVIFPPMTSIKKTEKKKKSKQLMLHSFFMSSEPQPGPSLTK